MNGEERRKSIHEILIQAEEPISGTELAKQFSVSRQVIVQDIALLRAEKIEIIATARGYIRYKQDESKIRRVLAVQHTREQIEDELLTIVDLGGYILDVVVEHPIYGQITANLMIGSRREADMFIKNMQEYASVPLMNLTRGVHLHTVEARSEKILDMIAKELREKGYLLSD